MYKSVHRFKQVKLRLVVTAQVVPIQAHDSSYTLELLRQAQATLGPVHPLWLLVMDRGFADGASLWTL